MKTTRNLITILIKLTARVQFCHNNFCCTALGIMLIVKLNAGRYTTAIIDNRYGIIGLNNNGNFGTVPR